METKYVFQVFGGGKKGEESKDEGKGYLVAWQSGDDVPVYARGTMYLGAYALRGLLAQAENNTTEAVIIRQKTSMIMGAYDADIDAVRVLVAKDGKEAVETAEDVHPEVIFGLSADVMTAASWLVNATKENFEEFSKLSPVGSNKSSAGIAKIAGLLPKKAALLYQSRTARGKKRQRHNQV